MTEIVFGALVLIALLLALTGLVVAARSLLMPEVPLTLTLNGQTRLPARSGQRLLAALLDGGVMVPSACAGAGTCGLCRVTIPEGGPEITPVEAARLTRADQNAGVHLACQIVLRADLGVEVEETLIGAEQFELVVAASRQLTPLIREIVLQMPKSAKARVFAGSFLQITAPPFALDYSDIEVPAAFEDQWRALRALSVTSTEEVTRAYSISNRPEDTAAGRLVLNIRLALPPPSVPQASPGIVSTWLFALRCGDRVQASGPFGTFRAQDTTREMIFIGGGVGMAPLRAMIFEQLNREGHPRKMSFWYGVRSLDDLYHADEFDALAARHDNFDWTVALSDPQADSAWMGARGFVHQVVFDRYLRDHPAPEACEYYLCGPPLMIRAVLAMLDDLGVPAGQILNDDFGV